MSAVNFANAAKPAHIATVPRHLLLGSVAVGCYALHAGVQISAGRPENLLWACHMAALFVGIGILLRLDILTAAGTLMLTVGVPAWLMNLFLGGDFFVSSIATHVGGWMCGVMGLRRKRYPAYGVAVAITLMGAMLLVSRLYTPMAANVNLAHRMWQPAASLTESWPWHLAIIIAVWTGLLSLADLVLPRIVAYRAKTPPQ